MEKFVNWNECLELEYARETKPNNEFIKSMLKMSEDKLKFSKGLKTDENNAAFVFTNFYDCLRMMCETIALKKGFKVYNHKCITQFLKIVLKEEKSARVFDDCRLIRNKINYYGKTVPKPEADKRISDINEIYNHLKHRYFE